MQKKLRLAYNPSFFFPFLLWVIAGGIILIAFTRRDIFHAANTNYNDALNELMFYTTWLGQGTVIVPVLVLLMLIPRFRNWWYFFTAVLCNVVPLLIQQSLKSFFDAPRPLLRFYDMPWIHYLPNWDYLLERSFPSGHSEGAFSFFCFLSLLLPPRYAKIGFLFFVLALSVCYSRMYLAAHFFEDVYAGSIIGALATTLIYTFMLRYKKGFGNRL